MNRIFLLIVITFLLSTVDGRGQDLILRNPVIIDYPDRIEADLQVFDEDFLLMNQLDKENFKLTENGVQREIVSITCPPKHPPEPFPNAPLLHLMIVIT